MPSSRWFSRFLRGWDRMLRPTFRFFGWLGRAFVVGSSRWGGSRNWRFFFQGLPAFVMVVTVALIALLRWSVSAAELEVRYQKKADEDFKLAKKGAPTLASAMVAYERLAAFKNDPKYLYDLAEAHQLAGDGDRAIKILTQIAPVDLGGYGPAHHSLGNLLMAVRLNDPNARRDALKHWDHALKSAEIPNEKKNAIRFSKADVYARIGNDGDESGYRAAEFELEKILKDVPQANLLYAQVLDRQHKHTAAKKAALDAAKFGRERVEKNRHVEAYTTYQIQALILAEDFPEAVAALKRFPRVQETPGYRLAAANIYADWQEWLGKKFPEKVGERLEKIYEGLKFNPQNPKLLQGVLELLGSDDPAVVKKTSEALPKILALSKEDAPAVHLLRGMDLYRRNEHDKAIASLERAWALDRNKVLLDVANNLAVLLTKHGKDADLDRAKELADFVVDKVPQSLAFRDTRGRVYFKRKEMDVAIIEFEQVKRLGDAAPDDLYGLLAEAYEKVRPPDLEQAQAYRELQAEVDRKKSKK